MEVPLTVGELYKRPTKSYPCRLIAIAPNLFSHHHSTAESKMVVLEFLGGKMGTICMLMEEFKDFYLPYQDKGE